MRIFVAETEDSIEVVALADISQLPLLIVVLYFLASQYELQNVEFFSVDNSGPN